MAKRLNFLDLWPIFFVAGTEEWEDWAQWGVWFRSGSQWVKGVPWFREVGRESHVNLRDIGWWIFMESWVHKFWNLVPRYGLYSWSSQLYPLKKLSCTIYNTWSGQLYPLKKLSCTILYVYNIYMYVCIWCWSSDAWLSYRNCWTSTRWRFVFCCLDASSGRGDPDWTSIVRKLRNRPMRNPRSMGSFWKTLGKFGLIGPSKGIPGSLT